MANSAANTNNPGMSQTSMARMTGPMSMSSNITRVPTMPWAPTSNLQGMVMTQQGGMGNLTRGQSTPFLSTIQVPSMIASHGGMITGQQDGMGMLSRSRGQSMSRIPTMPAVPLTSMSPTGAGVQVIGLKSGLMRSQSTRAVNNFAMPSNFSTNTSFRSINQKSQTNMNMMHAPPVPPVPMMMTMPHMSPMTSQQQMQQPQRQDNQMNMSQRFDQGQYMY